MQVKRVILDQAACANNHHHSPLAAFNARSQTQSSSARADNDVSFKGTESAEGGPNPLAVLVRGTKSAGGPDPL